MSEDAAEGGARRVVEQMVAALNGGDRGLLTDCLPPREEAVHICTDPTSGGRAGRSSPPPGHQRVEIRDWLAANPRVHVHFTPTLHPG